MTISFEISRMKGFTASSCEGDGNGRNRMIAVFCISVIFHFAVLALLGRIERPLPPVILAEFNVEDIEKPVEKPMPRQRMIPRRLP